MSTLPAGWGEIKLKNCVTVLDNLRVPINSDERNERLGEVPYYGATGQVGWIDDYLFDEELLLIGEDGAPFFDKSKPISYIIHGKSWVNNHAHVLRALPELTSNLYLKYFLDQFDFHDCVNGTTRLKLTQGSMNEIPVKLAPVNEQRRIVAKLEKLLSRVNAAQTRLATIPQILKRFRQSVLATACSGKLTADWRHLNADTESASALLERIRSSRRVHFQSKDAKEVEANLEEFPPTWLTVRIEELTCVQNGRAFPSKEYRESGVRLLRPGNLNANGQIVWSDKNTACLPMVWAEDYPDFILSSDELLMNLTAQSLKDEFLGRVCIKTDSIPALLNQRIARFSNHGADDLRPFLFVYFKSPQFRSHVNNLDTGTLIRHMHSKQVLSYVAPLPPLAEQQEIVRRVEALFKTADALEVRYLKAKAHVDKLTQSILARAFRGELVPQDPNDEPASSLLERIKREHSVKPKRKRGTSSVYG